MNWLARNTDALQAFGAVVTALVALAALIAIPLQMNANAALQSKQSARDIYREFLALSVQNPQFGTPDYCALKGEPKSFAANGFYVDYLIYTAEQVTALSATGAISVNTWSCAAIAQTWRRCCQR